MLFNKGEGLMRKSRMKNLMVIIVCVITMLISTLAGNYRVHATVNTDLTFDYTGSTWSETSDAIIGSGANLSLMSNESGSDFELDVDIRLDGSGSQASQGGFIIRSGGSDYYNSYLIMIHKTSTLQRIEIQKFTASGATYLATANKTIDWDTYYNIKVVANGSNLKIYFDNETTPSIDVNDTLHSDGGIGLFRAGTDVSFNNINLVDTSTPSTTPLTFDYTGSAWSESSDIITGTTDLSIMSNESGSDFELDVDIKLDGSGTQASQGGVVVRGGSPNNFVVDKDTGEVLYTAVVKSVISAIEWNNDGICDGYSGDYDGSMVMVSSIGSVMAKFDREALSYKNLITRRKDKHDTNYYCDINGDGRTDLVILMMDASGNYHVAVWYNTDGTVYTNSVQGTGSSFTGY